MRADVLLEKLRERRHAKPFEKDWRVRRAEYLIETGRLDQLRAEGLTHAIFRDQPGRDRADVPTRGARSAH